MNFPFTQGQPRRPNLSEDSVASDPGRPPVVAPGSTRTAGRPWVDPRSVVRSANKRGRPAVDRTHGSTPGRFSESCCCAWRVWVWPEVDIPQLSAVVAPGSTSLVVCCRTPVLVLSSAVKGLFENARKTQQTARSAFLIKRGGTELKPERHGTVSLRGACQELRAELLLLLDTLHRALHDGRPVFLVLTGACQFGHGVGGFTSNFIHSAPVVAGPPLRRSGPGTSEGRCAALRHRSSRTLRNRVRRCLPRCWADVWRKVR